VAATVNKEDVTSRELASLMVGKEHSTVLPDKDTLQSEPVLTLSDVTAYGDRGTIALDRVLFRLEQERSWELPVSPETDNGNSPKPSPV